MLSLSAAAQTGDNFNSRAGLTLQQVKGFLQEHCWIFSGFDVNVNGWNAGIEGDGAMVSLNGTSGIYSPIVQVPGSLAVSFKYKFNQVLRSDERMSLKVYLTSYDNNTIALLETLEFADIDPSSVYSYKRNFESLGSGLYRIFLSFHGNTGTSRIAIDDLNVNAPLQYPGGCNAAPEAANDWCNGLQNHTATGSVVANDMDPNHEYFSTYLITGSSDGTVDLNSNGNFTFTPNPGFTGNSTTFSYKICDQGSGPLCSEDATVTISFPQEELLPSSLLDFTGRYQMEGRVSLNWVTNREQNSSVFLIERSLDGSTWQKTGTLKAQGNSTVKQNYSFTDKVNRNTVAKRDLYYRLKLIDVDGRYSLSRMLVVRVYNTRSLKMVSVTPNPALNDIAVMLEINEPSYVVMKITNSAGNEIMRKSAKIKEGPINILMDNSGKLQPGLYIFEVIINSKERMIVKLVKE